MSPSPATRRGLMSLWNCLTTWLKAIPAEVWPDGLQAKVTAEQKRIKEQAAERARIKAFEAGLGTELLEEYHQRRDFYARTK